MVFVAGDIVKLKSGGEKMTVESLHDGLVDCVWMGEKKKAERGSFEPVVLEKFQNHAVGASSVGIPGMARR